MSDLKLFGQYILSGLKTFCIALALTAAFIVTTIALVVFILVTTCCR